MKLVVEERPDNIMVVSWAEPTMMDASQADELRAYVGEIEQKSPRVVLDMSQVQFVDSSIIGALVGFLRRARSAGGDVKLAAVTPEVEQIFEVTRLQRVFRIFPSVAAAVTEFAQPASG